MNHELVINQSSLGFWVVKEDSKATASEHKAKPGHGLSSSPLSFSPFGFSIILMIILETKFAQICAV